MNSADWHICVLIPASNEEDLLPRCLKSVLVSQSLLPAHVTCDILVVADRCSDRTRAIAENLLGPNGMVVNSDAGIVGNSRALAADVALQRYTGPVDRCWFANTDADCCVPRSWLVDQLLLAEEGLEAMAGTIEVDNFAEHIPGLDLLFRANYVIHADGSHPHVHGSNLGIRADAYLRAGGWASLSTGEDHDLWRRLELQGVKRISLDRIRVKTSGRRRGRAPHGFADALVGYEKFAV